MCKKTLHNRKGAQFPGKEAHAAQPARSTQGPIEQRFQAQDAPRASLSFPPPSFAGLGASPRWGAPLGRMDFCGHSVAVHLHPFSDAQSCLLPLAMQFWSLTC